jgi:hypothetical protein
LHKTHVTLYAIVMRHLGPCQCPFPAWTSLLPARH